MEELDKENKGFIELSQLETLIKQKSEEYPTQFRNAKSMTSAEYFVRTYWRRAWVVGVWIIMCASLFVWKFKQYEDRRAFKIMGYCVCIAKGAAGTLKFNMALIFLPVCRNSITWLRKRPFFSSIIPFNDNVNFHKLIAGGIVIGVILHGGMHLACDFPRISGSTHFLFLETIGVGFHNRQPSYFDILKTTEVAVGIAMVVLMCTTLCIATRPFQRLAGYNAFWFSHHFRLLLCTCDTVFCHCCLVTLLDLFIYSYIHT